MVPYPPRLKPLATHECRYGALIQQSNGCSSCAAWGKSLDGRKQCKYCRWDYFEHGSSFSWNFFQMDWTDLVAKTRISHVSTVFLSSPSQIDHGFGFVTNPGIEDNSSSWSLHLLSSSWSFGTKEAMAKCSESIGWYAAAWLQGELGVLTIWSPFTHRWNMSTQNMKLLSYDLYTLYV